MIDRQVESILEIKQRTYEMANRLRKDAPSHRPGRTPPRQPDYPDQLSAEQIEAIKAHVDPKGELTDRRELLYAAAW
jgi:hypothetical protein